MTKAKLTGSVWQAQLNAFAWAFTRRGLHRCADWITAMAINVEEQTIETLAKPWPRTFVRDK